MNDQKPKKQFNNSSNDGNGWGQSKPNEGGWGSGNDNGWGNSKEKSGGDDWNTSGNQGGWGDSNQDSNGNDGSNDHGKKFKPRQYKDKGDRNENYMKNPEGIVYKSNFVLDYHAMITQGYKETTHEKKSLLQSLN
jgi:hypothetical protein